VLVWRRETASAPTEGERGHVEWFEGDAIKVLASMPAAFVDAIISDPAYGVEWVCGMCDRRPSSIEKAVVC